MKISGFTMVRNATKLYYPIKESIESILPICDEFIVALGKGDEDDQTESEIRSINSDKIRIIHTIWDLEKYPNGMVYAQQTDLAKSHCTGDWLFYIQSDEVVHERFLPAIKRRCEELLSNEKIDGLLFDYKHFWGDYDHFIVSHAWYPREIRIIRNRADIHSWRDAQSFRCMPDFDGLNYRQQQGTFKLSVAKVDACIFHYGWVRPPVLMQRKRKSFSSHYRGLASAQKEFTNEHELFDYGDLSRYHVFRDSHPQILSLWIAKFNWQHQLYPHQPIVKKHKHEKFKYRLLTFVEQNFLNGKLIGGFKNYKLIKV
jgi:hypothetical protein